MGTAKSFSASSRTNKSILSYLVGAVLEWCLMMMLLFNSMFIFVIYRFAQQFCLNKPCLCCSTLFVPHTDLLCHHHAATTMSGYVVDDKSVLKGTQHKHKLLSFHNYKDDHSFNSFDKSAKFIRDLYLGENVVEFTFIDEALEKEFVSNDGGLNLGYALLEAQPQTDDSLVTVIKNKIVNEDESYSIAYTAEGDLVMDLCRNLASAKLGLTPSSEEQAALDEYDEKTERNIELNAVDQPPENSNGVGTRSCVTEGTVEHVHEQIDQVARSICQSPTSLMEDLVCEQANNTLTSVNQQNGEVVADALLTNSPLPLESYQEQFPASSRPLSADNHSHSSKVDNRGSDQVEESSGLTESYSAEAAEHPLTISLDLINNEVEKLPDTPTSLDGAQNLYMSWLLHDKRDSVSDEMLDGSINSDFEFGEGISTVDKLKTALKVERRALHALYAELEEERNASAVAASQTMAMINRLQEEKASVQMEALQYQRMMEEQSEYDQEALQLLNELMVKRERENEELEKELQICRKKVIDYETRLRLMMLSRKEESLTSDRSSVSFSSAEESDGVSLDLKVNFKNMNGFECKEENELEKTPFSDVLNVEESLSHFEEERLSILEQLKVLEENLFTLDDSDDGFPLNHNCSFFMNGNTNGISYDTKGNGHQEMRLIGPKSKALLPLFDATVDGDENGERGMNGNGNDLISYPHSSSSMSESENKNISIEEEVDHVYQRLQTLEADSEFLRHCFSSLKGGDKGLEMLQEILQHLRNLRSIELEARK